MARLKQLSATNATQLLPQSIIGRDRICDVRLQDPLCSARHAHIMWTGRAWELHDLSSKNGTWVNGRRLDRTKPAVLVPGMQLAFGNPPAPWEVVDVRPPVACAINQDGRHFFADQSVLALPSEEQPLVTLFVDSSGTWWLEEVDNQARVCPTEVRLTIDGDTWRIVAPNAIEPTREFVPQSQMSHTKLNFHTSNERGELLIEALCNGVAIPLETRSFHSLLFALAGIRLKDKDRGVDITNAGWVHKTDLMELMDMGENDLNVQIYRARRQLAGIGVQGASGLIERRAPDGMIRLGVADVALLTVA